ncbi:MAG: NADH dehydrogenase (quinone) subunit D [Deltaproteobacteria bacterium GWA2_38_16]|nr:MAG: NADH dehydrogenase (quinone) subunit D [Deltaproteobacteria bacterium GWA2_38_16]OGQ02550.1 MAG: NADH dehydrogenase (quinone) subunit D [Deltaproteobacteria bacterium RIFCSPHIGHO2_02_FULL_38_15]OGQ30586.1 MAG: NADH dehydrogenase (quinone) subunit D [Deltaproteobacteria bacterium RIFCSPLOWO2_01_FULL_38_9]HBQ20995.1 NADH-quinone oxidoreductase subunit C [Deltaproteobacteria bacterium]
MTALLETLKARFPSHIESYGDYRGDLSLYVKKEGIPALLKYLKEEQKFEFLMDICGADTPTQKERFEVIYHLFSLASKKRIRIKTKVAENEEITSITPLWKSANWYERETYDMFGVKFSGHPNLKRILCHQKFIGHPLRKDFDPENRQSLDEAPAIEELMDITQEDLYGNQFEKRMLLNLGPSHPASHGTLRTMALLEGEKIIKADVEIGYLHRCFEKMAETHLYHQVIPYTERLNYTSGPMNNFGFCLAMEKLLGVIAPPRAQAIRVIIGEFSRIIDHLVVIGTGAVDLGALTNFWFAFAEREKVYTLFEKWGGGRMFPRGMMIGGVMYDFPEGWVDEAKKTIKSIRAAIQDIDRLLTNNRIFINRCKDVGRISKEDAIDYGLTGPLLRACGVELDFRKLTPYSGYENYDFEVPISTQGDVYDRYLVRMEEIRQSCRIIEQAIDKLPDGPIEIDDKSIVLPQKEDVYNNIEGLMNHFMLVIEGIKPPKGEIYNYIESANGEIGFYIVSNGTGLPHRIHCRAPSFAHYQAYPKMIEGLMIADAIATIGSLNIIAGELDR